MNICSPDYDLERARREMALSTDDGDTELVEVEIKVVQIFGPKEAKHFVSEVQCQTCGEHIEIEQPASLAVPIWLTEWVQNMMQSTDYLRCHEIAEGMIKRLNDENGHE